MDEYPRGYPKVAAFQDCDPMLRIFRKFGWLQIHVLLDLQDELQALEEELEEHNTFTFDSGQGIRLCARRLDYKREGSRKELISQIHQKLIQYGNLSFWRETYKISKCVHYRRPAPAYAQSTGNQKPY